MLTRAASPSKMDTYFIKCSSVTHESANIANIFIDSRTISSFAFGSSFYNGQLFFFKTLLAFLAVVQYLVLSAISSKLLECYIQRWVGG